MATETKTLFTLLLTSCLAACGSAAPTAGTAAVADAPEPTTATSAVAPTPSTLLTRTFQSQALGVNKSYVVYLPAGYSAERAQRYPVVYLLHGLTGDETWWTRDGRLKETADELSLDALVVMPDGDDSFYVNWASTPDRDRCLGGKRPFGSEADMTTYCVATADYETYLAEELVAQVDASFHTIPSRQGRGLGGVSMGGYGALAVGMRNPTTFGAVASHSGVAALTYKGPYPYQEGKTELFSSAAEEIAAAGAFGPHFAKIFGTEQSYWAERDPALLADVLEPGQLAIYIDCGAQDQLRLHNGARYLHERLTARGIQHEFTIEDGGHDVPFFRSRTDDGLGFFQGYFRQAP